MLSEVRNGKFTSSSIYNLMKKGRGSLPSAATESYIQEKLMERRLGRGLETELTSRPTAWGHLLEQYVQTKLDIFEYEYCSDVTIEHPTLPWAGTPDFMCSDRVVDAKCPFTLKAFCELADIAIANDLEALKAKKPEYYWQLVSNAILTSKDKAELIIFCPYQTELEAIRDFADNVDVDQSRYLWIYLAADIELPYLIEGNYYQNMYKFVFDVPVEDKQLLVDAVEVASKRLEVL